MLPELNKNTDFNTFLKVANAPALGNNILNADNIKLTNDETYKFTNDLWWEVMNNSRSTDCLVSFEEFMEKIREMNNDFSYQILRGQGEVTGCLWMTATMRKNFELFGSSICVDAMKRDINKMGMPYIAVTMHNEMNRVCVGCEGIVLAEREEAYAALIDFQTKFSRRKKDNIFAFSADGFLSQAFVDKIGLTNATFVMDHYHLFHDVLPKKFGGYFKGIEIFLRNMANAQSAEQCEENYYRALEHVKDHHKHNERDINNLTEFYNDRQCYSLYCLHRVKGLRGKRGSTAAESNHSSVLFHLNDGERVKNQYCEHPTTLFKDLIKRADEHITIGNEILNHEREMMVCEIRKLSAESSPDQNELLKACDALCYRSFLRFKEHWKQAQNYYLDKKNNQVSRIDNEAMSMSPRCFFVNEKGQYSRCNCRDAVQYQEQCVHEIVLHHFSFKIELFDKWHIRRNTISSSTLPDDLRSSCNYSSPPRLTYNGDVGTAIGSPLKDTLLGISQSMDHSFESKCLLRNYDSLETITFT